jgi:hypothetical protein
VLVCNRYCTHFFAQSPVTVKVVPEQLRDPIAIKGWVCTGHKVVAGMQQDDLLPEGVCLFEVFLLL